MSTLAESGNSYLVSEILLLQLLLPPEAVGRQCPIQGNAAPPMSWLGKGPHSFRH